MMTMEIMVLVDTVSPTKIFPKNAPEKMISAKTNGTEIAKPMFPNAI